MIPFPWTIPVPFGMTPSSGKGMAPIALQASPSQQEPSGLGSKSASRRAIKKYSGRKQLAYLLKVRENAFGKKPSQLVVSGRDTLDQTDQMVNNIGENKDLPGSPMGYGKGMKKIHSLPLQDPSAVPAIAMGTPSMEGLTTQAMPEIKTQNWGEAMKKTLLNFKEKTGDRVVQKINQVHGFFVRHFKFLKSREVRLGRLELVMN